MRLLLVVGLICGLGHTFSAHASAQDHARRGRVVRIEVPFDVRGHVQGPRAFYILDRTAALYRPAELRESFTQSVVRSVRASAF